MIQRMVRGIAACVLLVIFAGCQQALVGDWRSIEPAAIPPEVQRIRQIAFARDGLFEARMLQNHRIRPMKGMYQFTGTQLILTPDVAAGSSRYVYAAELAGNVLSLTQNSMTNRLCREYIGSPATQPASVPALPTPSTQPDLVVEPTE